MLLDLLGSRDTPLSSLHSRTHPYFEKLTVFERQYREQGLIKWCVGASGVVWGFAWVIFWGVGVQDWAAVPLQPRGEGPPACPK